MQLTSYAGLSGFLTIEFSAHQALRLSQFLEELQPVIPTHAENNYSWFQCGVPARSNWAEYCLSNKTIRSFLIFLYKLEVNGMIERRSIINPLHIDCFSQVLLDNEPTLSYPQISLIYKNGIAFSHYPDPVTIHPPSILISQLREEGVDLFNKDTLLQRLKECK